MLRRRDNRGMRQLQYLFVDNYVCYFRMDTEIILNKLRLSVQHNLLKEK